MPEVLTFKAVISPLQSAIMADGGQGGSVRIRLDAYGVDLNRLVEYCGKELEVNISITKTAQ